MQKRYLTITGAIAIVLTVVAVILFSQKTSIPTDDNVQEYNNITSTSTDDESAPAATAPSAPKNQKVPSQQPSPALSYSQALNLYENQKIQIASPCQILPPDLVFKNETELMIDNRTPEAKNIYFNGTKYAISGYGFKVINLYSSTLPHIIIINCGTGVNNGRIILNK